MRSMRELRGCADGEEVVISGKVGIGTGGITDWLDIGDRPKAATTTPLFNVTFLDGGFVMCGFDDTPRADYAAWLEKNPPGTVVTVRGTHWGGHPVIISNCKVLPGGFK